MFYKVMKDDKVIDVLDKITYLKYQKSTKMMLLCKRNEAQAILSSDNKTIWHEITLHKLPDSAPEYDTVRLVEIDKYEYKQLKALNMKTPEAIIDEFLLTLFENGIL